MQAQARFPWQPLIVGGRSRLGRMPFSARRPVSTGDGCNLMRIVTLHCWRMIQIRRVKSCILFASCFLLTVVPVAFAQPTFTSLHVFGDSATSTTDGPTSPYYYENRRSNGRMWVEVMAGWRGLSFDITNHNLSFWEHYSPILVTNVDAYVPPADVSTALFVVWVNNADMYKNISTSPGLVYDDTVLSVWTNNNNAWISNHFTVITNLYFKGVRTVLMPNAVDLTKTPNFAPGLNNAEREWIRQRTLEFNSGFQDMLDDARATLTDMTIYSSDIFTLFEDVLATPSDHGMTNPGVGALNDFSLGDYSLDGPGADYVFWDHIHPTAKFQMLFAEAAQKLIWPVEIDSISATNGSNELHVINIPIGLDGVVRGSTNLADWPLSRPFVSTNSMQMISVPVSGPTEFYRLEFPLNWVWP